MGLFWARLSVTPSVSAFFMFLSPSVDEGDVALWLLLRQLRRGWIHLLLLHLPQRGELCLCFQCQRIKVNHCQHLPITLRGQFIVFAGVFSSSTEGYTLHSFQGPFFHLVGLWMCTDSLQFQTWLCLMSVSCCYCCLEQKTHIIFTWVD